MLVINCFKVFDLVQVMTGGGPGRATNVLVYEIYNEAFVKFNFWLCISHCDGLIHHRSSDYCGPI